MLCPEVWNFQPPRCNISINRVPEGNFSAVLDDLVLPHYFNHTVSVVLPDAETVPADLSRELTKNADYYKVKNLPVYEFTDREFVDTFVRNGSVTALSLGTQIDIDDCVAITPSGHLLFSLCRETYQTLGIEGKPSSAFGNKRPERYFININIKGDQVSRTKSEQLRLRKALTEHVKLTMDFIITWDPPGGQICPSSIAAYFKDKGYSVYLCSPRVTSARDYNIKVPSFDTAEQEDILEWLGAHMLGINCRNLTNKETENGADMNVALLQCDGLFTTAQIHRLVEKLRTYAEKPTCAPWVSVHVQGFADAPVSWHLQEHQYYMHGVNQYTLFIRPDNGSVVFYKVCTSNKKLK